MAVSTRMCLRIVSGVVNAFLNSFCLDFQKGLRPPLRTPLRNSRRVLSFHNANRSRRARAVRPRDLIGRHGGASQQEHNDFNQERETAQAADYRAHNDPGDGST